MSLGNGRCTANYRATEGNLSILLPRSKGFVQGAGRALSPKASRPGKHNARLATHLHTRLLSFMRNWETKTRLSGGSTLPIRSATHIYTASELTSYSTPYVLTHGLLSWCGKWGCRSSNSITLWKDADPDPDPDIPILIAAKAEYANLH